MNVGNDLTQGSVAKTLVRFTVPFLLSNVLHTLYSIVDMYIVGQYADATQISAVSIGAAVMLLVNGLEPVQGPYYRWSDLKAHLQRRIAQFTF